MRHNLAYSFEADFANVFYVEQDETLVACDCEDNSVELHNINRERMIRLVRNWVCNKAIQSPNINEKPWERSEMSEHEMRNLHEINSALNCFLGSPPGKSEVVIAMELKEKGRQKKA
jgi:hypothetical protein